MAGCGNGGGPSGFPRRAESEYDTFGTAHSSTSISAALGMAIAAQRKGEQRARRRGDRRRRDERRHGVRGAEQRRHRRRRPARDPQRQRDVDLGAGRRAQQLPRASCCRRASTTRCAAAARKCCRSCRRCKELAKRWEEHMKGMVLPGTLFEEFGFNYIGPIDGHDVDTLVQHARQRAGSSQGPQLLHVITQEGLRLRARRGRSDPLSRRHEVRSRRSASSPKPPAKPTYTQVFGDWLCDMAARDPRLVAHHAGDARGLGPRPLFAGVSRPLLRRRHRRAARGDVRRGPRLRGHEAGRRDLFDVPAARLRPADPRRRAAEPAGGVRDRPRRHRRRRRRDAHRRVRPLVPALPAQHDGDGARRRERMPADALHGVHARHADRGALSARQRAPASRSRPR